MYIYREFEKKKVLKLFLDIQT